MPVMSSKQGKASAIPKFSSFKPKLDATPAQHEAELEESRRHKERPVSGSRDRHRSARDTSNHGDGTRLIKLSDRPSPREQDKERDSLFVYDKRGDPLVRRYGGINRRDVPNYRRFGSGRILGVDGYMRIDQTGSREEFFILGHHESRSLLSSDRKTLLAKGGYYKSQPVRVRRQKSQGVSGSEDFVSLVSSKKRKRDDGESGGESNGDRPSYRSIHGKSKNHEHSDSDIDYASDASADPEDWGLDDPVRLKSVELSRRVREHPQDIDAWLQLVGLQDTLLQISVQESRRPTAAEVKSSADIKLSMLQQAYSHATTDPQCEKLQLRIMQEGSKIWDPKTLSKRWDEALEKHGADCELWRAFANFQQTTLSAFQYEKVKDLYAKRLQQLETTASATESHTGRIRIYEEMIYVFLRATRFISDAGYKERATAAWQATLEMTFARPATATEQMNTKVRSGFQDFWESEVPRMGEESARGWATFERDSGAQEPPEPKAFESPTLPSTRDGYRAWAVVEGQKARSAPNPARTLDEGIEDDPFRVVMFADIHDVLLYFPSEAIPSIRRQLLDAFLIFCQLPPILCPTGIVQDMLQDSFLSGSSPNLVTTETSPDLLLVSEEQTKKPLELTHDYQQFNITPEVLFPQPHWFRGLKKIRGEIPECQYQWISTTLKQLARLFGVVELGPYHLAFESVNEPGNEKKTAKALLKQDSTNVSLYVCYSMLEWARGNKGVAHTTLGAAAGITTISAYNKVSMGIAAAWMELEDGNLPKSILQLCTFSSDSTPTASASDISTASTTQILKTRQFLSSNRDYLLSSGDATNAIIYAEALALLEYLTQQSNKEPSSGNQGDIWSAMSSISTCSDELVSRDLADSPFHERLLQSAARLLYYHARQGPFRAGFLREQLVKYIRLFPRNTMFLSLLAWREARLSVDDRVRAVLADAGDGDRDVGIGVRAFAIRHEMRVGNAHSTRAAFERALESDTHDSSSGHHPGLWIAYVRFCHAKRRVLKKSKSDGSGSEAKAVLYRALRRCPWAKDVFMEAFGTLVREVDSAELRSVYGTLVDKGLRVHVDMDEFVESWRRDRREREGAR
ncbi:DUF1740-domain-containing protein [Hypoxylon sp. FL1284]|nr:DUF1740-domain-containing protein [Hypoxylon sp. FL1284]